MCALVIFALPVALLFVVVVFDPDLGSAAVGLLGFLILFMYTTGGFWYRALTTHLVLATRKGEPVVFRKLVGRTFGGFPRVSTVGFLVWFGTVFGLLLLVIPGIIFGTRRAPAISVAVVEGKGAFFGRRYRDRERSAMRRSRDLVKDSGNSFEVFAVIAAKNVVYGVFNSIFPILFVFAVPWGALAASLVYFELAGIEAGEPALPARPEAPLGQAADSVWRPKPSTVFPSEPALLRPHR
ncbi:MAG: hypothetical protein WDZ37_07355 [Solirubrobacterales bacterium]